MVKWSSGEIDVSLFELKLTVNRGDLQNNLWGESEPNGRHFTVRLFKVCGCTLPR